MSKNGCTSLLFHSCSYHCTAKYPQAQIQQAPYTRYSATVWACMLDLLWGYAFDLALVDTFEFQNKPSRSNGITDIGSTTLRSNHNSKRCMSHTEIEQCAILEKKGQYEYFPPIMEKQFLIIFLTHLSGSFYGIKLPSVFSKPPFLQISKPLTHLLCGK